MNKATPAPESAEPLKYAALLNRLFEMTKAPYYATACDTLTQAEMVIVGLERENDALRAEVERLRIVADRVAGLNPDAGEIGAGMLVQLVDAARAALKGGRK